MDLSEEEDRREDDTQCRYGGALNIENASFRQMLVNPLIIDQLS